MVYQEMNFVSVALMFVLAMNFVIPSKHALHMFQQNRYELTRYTKWLREVKKTGTNLYILLCYFMLSFLLLFTVPLFFGMVGLLVISTVFLGYQVWKESKKKYIKNLVYTSRVIRQIIVLAVLELCIFLLIVYLFPTIFASCLLLILSILSPWVFIYLVSIITEPVEMLVRNWYLNDAKRILKEHTDLIKIGITGSFGKTSTKNIMQAVLSEQFNSLMTPASFNTLMGVTRTIREYLKPIHQVFICEMGADKVGDITELMEFVHPKIGVVTSIGAQHLATFKTQENITFEKMQMVEKLPCDGLAVLNYDNELIRHYQIKNKVSVASYGIEYTGADYLAKDIRYTSNGSRFTLVNGEESISFETKLLGRHNILNILSAIAVVRYLGVSWPVIQKAVKSMPQVEHRLQQKRINGYHFIDDAFNANPVGSSMALDVLSFMPGKRVIVTPGMIDLGERQYEINQSFGTKMKGKVDLVLLVGEKQTEPIVDGLRKSGFDMSKVIVFSKVHDAFNYIYNNLSEDDTILLENDLPDAFSH